MLEMSLAGAVPVVIVVTVALTAARFLPMTVALLPMLRTTAHASWRHYAAVHLLAMTGWAASMRRCPELPPEQRLPWFVGFALINWLACIVATAVGYELAESLPPAVRQGLVFVGPLYFVLILSGETRTRQSIAAIAFGAVAGPAIHLVAPQWSVVLAGLIGGTLAFVLVKGARRA
jgi:predicted branched-subunit amino acid permease